MLLDGVFFDDRLHDLVRMAFWKDIRPYCHRVSTCEDCMDVLRQHCEHVFRIKSNPEATPLQSFVAPKKCWPKTKTAVTLSDYYQNFRRCKNNIEYCRLKILQIQWKHVREWWPMMQNNSKNTKIEEHKNWISLSKNYNLRRVLVWIRYWTTPCCFQLVQPERRSWTQSRLYEGQMLNWSKLLDNNRWRSASSMKSLLRTVLLTYWPAHPQGDSLTTFLSSLARCRWTEKTKKINIS